MRRENFVHLAFWIAFFAFVSVFRNFLSLDFWPFWLGGLIGTLLPDTDHLIYVFFISPQELTSQRISFLVKKKEFGRILSLLYETRNERKHLVFHSFLFQIIVLVLLVLVASTSTSLLVKGIVLAMSLHLAVDQLADVFELKNLSNWGTLFSTENNYSRAVLYISASFLLVCIAGFLL